MSCLKKKKWLRFSGEAANLRAFLGPSDRMLQDLLHPPAAYFYWANVVAKLLAQGPVEMRIVGWASFLGKNAQLMETNWDDLQYGSKWSYWWGPESWNLIPEGTQSSHHLMYSWRFTGAFWSSEANASLFTATYRKWGIVLDSSCNNSSTWVNSRLPPISAKTTVKGGLQPARILSWVGGRSSFRFDHPFRWPLDMTTRSHQSQPINIWYIKKYWREVPLTFYLT